VRWCRRWVFHIHKDASILFSSLTIGNREFYWSNILVITVLFSSIDVHCPTVNYWLQFSFCNAIKPLLFGRRFAKNQFFFMYFGLFWWVLIKNKKNIILIYFRVKNILKTIAITTRVSSLNQVANMNVYVQITWQTSKSYTSNSFNLPIRYDTATSCSFIARNPWGHYRVRVRVTRPNSKVTHHRSTFRAHVQLIKPGP
jgi:hypothetical protein